MSSETLNVILTIIGSILLPVAIYALNGVISHTKTIAQMEAKITALERGGMIAEQLIKQNTDMSSQVAVLKEKLENQERSFKEKFEHQEKKLDKMERMLSEALKFAHLKTTNHGD